MSGRERGVLVGLMLLGACQRAPAPPATASTTLTFADTTLQSAAKFTQDFYDWYRGQNDRMDAALKDRRAAFEPTLLAALDADGAAQAKDSTEVVGLDWDPFLESQEVCDPYTVTGAVASSDTVDVSVKAMCKEIAPHTGPDVIAQVRRTATGWVFVDFRHADNKGSLRQDLAELRQERDSTAGHRKH